MKGRFFFGLLTALCLMFAFDVGAAILPAQHRPTTEVVVGSSGMEVDMLAENNQTAIGQTVNAQEAVSPVARYYTITPKVWKQCNKDAIPNIGSSFIYLQNTSLYRSYTPSGGLSGRK